MGQYYIAVNLDKKQFVRPHACGDGAKLMEFGLSGMGTMSCLAILLADGNGRGGGDLRSGKPIIGSWAGDRIVITGDYADEGRFVPDDARTDEGRVPNLYNLASEEFEDVSIPAMRALADDEYVRRTLEEAAATNPWQAKQLREVLHPGGDDPAGILGE